MNTPSWLPNWRDPTKYPDPKTAPLRQWAWEFLRRNSEYQTDAILASRWPAKPKPLDDAALLEKLQSIHTDQGVLDPERRQWKRWVELQESQIAKVGELARKWNLRRGILPDPANANAWDEDEFELPGHSLRSYPARHFWTGTPCRFMGTPKHPDEVSVVFDLKEPLLPQLTAARRHLLWLKREYVTRGWVENCRLRAARPVSLRLYLQVIDAKSVGVRGSEIAKTLFSRVPNRHPEFHGNRRVIDAAAAARQLITGGYVNLRIRSTVEN